jgi:hypothetical protein
MDMGARRRDTRTVSRPGSSRQRLVGVLNTAFAEGLLSERTHSYRLGLLFGPRLVDQQRLVGDLTLRRSRSSRTAAARRAFSALVASGRAVARTGRTARAPLLLVLDHANSEQLLVGRHPACDLVLGEPSVSRRHAQLTHRDGKWVIQDLASTNGTLVNGERVGRAALRAGDLVTLGELTILLD